MKKCKRNKIALELIVFKLYITNHKSQHLLESFKHPFNNE